jgi:uncharacterized membrane protein (UPF0127 family)
MKLLLMMLAFGQAGAAAAQLATFPKSELTIETASGKHKFRIEMAVTPNQKTQGLMYRRTMAADAGMLFDYGHAEPVAMWMRNTLIPLDMLFIGTDGRVVNVHERAIPGSLDTIPSNGPVQAVLELNGGTVARLGIKPGDRIIHPAFKSGG